MNLFRHYWSWWETRMNNSSNSRNIVLLTDCFCIVHAIHRTMYVAVVTRGQKTKYKNEPFNKYSSPNDACWDQHSILANLLVVPASCRLHVIPHIWASNPKGSSLKKQMEWVVRDRGECTSYFYISRLLRG